jgi:hypothetical protein
MRSAGNFHPEWGYLAPAPSFLRTARTVIVATTVGAIAGAAVVFSLVDRPGDDALQSSVSARTLATTQAGAATQIRARAAGDQNQAARPALAGAPDQDTGASDSGTHSTPQPRTGIAALAELPAPADAAVETSPSQNRDQAAPADAANPTPAPESPPVQKKVAKKHRSTPRYAWRGEQPNGFVRQPLALQGLFNYSDNFPQGRY